MQACRHARDGIKPLPFRINGDLWAQLAALVGARGRHTVAVTWVKGPVPEQDFADGHADASIVVFNAFAGVLASERRLAHGEAASRHAALCVVCIPSYGRLVVTVQAYLVNVLRRRLTLLHAFIEVRQRLLDGAAGPPLLCCMHALVFILWIFPQPLALLHLVAPW